MGDVDIDFNSLNQKSPLIRVYRVISRRLQSEHLIERTIEEIRNALQTASSGCPRKAAAILIEIDAGSLAPLIGANESIPKAPLTTMDGKFRYIVPVGTRVEIRNIKGTGQLRQHVTRKELQFADRTNTGYDGHVFYFQYGDWVIAVNADDVL